ncbi:MAG TPA: L-lactate permease, partial [Mycobacteriales bacterium]|nr:L-lactate permease [Mycobacteriales bacterium]
MYRQVLDPVADSLAASSLVAALPLLTLFVLLGVLRMKAWIAALISLAVSILVAVLVYPMPLGQSLLAASEGAAFGFFPILWIVLNAIWIYNMTVETGHADVLRRSFASVSDDQRIQAVIVAFCFGALLEALAGFGTPVAITSVMLIALGFRPIKAAAVALVANTAPVAFGALATPIVTLATVTGISQDDLGAMVGRQTPLLALFVPLALVFIIDRRNGLRETWPAAVACGVAFAIAQFVTSNYISVPLTDIVAALAGAGAVVILLRVWQPAGSYVENEAEAEVPAGSGGRRGVLGRGTAEAARIPGTGQDADAAAGRPRLSGSGSGLAANDEPATGGGRHRDAAGGVPGAGGDAQAGPDSRADVLRAYAPYLIIIAVFVIAQLPGIKGSIADTTQVFKWPGLDLQNATGKPLSLQNFTFNWLAAGGTLLLIAGLITIPVLRISPARAFAAYLRTYRQLVTAIVTVMAVLALAYVMNASGQTATLGNWMGAAGGVFAVLSPILGWLGVAVTGSDTSSNSLFGALQVTAAGKAGLDPLLMAASNSSGGVLGKMVSPQNLAIAAAAVGLAGREGDLFRRVLAWSLLLLAVMILIVVLQSTAVLSW